MSRAWSALCLAVVLPAAELSPTEEALLGLLKVRRIYVERMSGETANHVRDMIISSLQRSGLFVVTENPERADATLKGSAEDLIFTDTFQYSEGISARVGAGSGGYNSSSRTNNRRQANASVSEQESARTAERKHESAASVRLVNRDGDVVWSTTKESLGGKFRGASADVAEKIVKQLAEDIQRARRLKTAGSSP